MEGVDLLEPVTEVGLPHGLHEGARGHDGPAAVILLGEHDDRDGERRRGRSGPVVVRGNERGVRGERSHGHGRGQRVARPTAWDAGREPVLHIGKGYWTSVPDWGSGDGEWLATATGELCEPRRTRLGSGLFGSYVRRRART